MSTKEKAAPEAGTARKTFKPDSHSVALLNNSDKITMTGRELLLFLAKNISELCGMVSSWRDEQEQLRARIERLEKGRAA